MFTVHKQLNINMFNVHKQMYCTQIQTYLLYKKY